MLVPFSNKPKITVEDVSIGFVTRYFVKQLSSKKITEIDKVQYDKFVRNPYYTAIAVPWAIAGYDKDILDNSGNLILGAVNRNLQITKYYEEKMSGLSNILKNPLEYFNGKLVTPRNKVVQIPPPEPSRKQRVTYTIIKDEVEDGISISANTLPDNREYQAEFEVAEFYISSSTTARPDAVSFDYTTAFTLGPVTLGDPNTNLFEKVWRVRADDTNNIWYSVETESGWSTELLLFSYVGNPIIEIDTALDQSGRINIVAQRNTGTGDAPQVWLYWFDPTLNNFAFQNLGNGRTPRMSLDNWQEITSSDLLVFYVDDSTNKIRYRVQSDRFTIVYDTPVITTQNTYIEKVGFASDYRYRVTYLERDTINGTYQIKQLATRRYPVILPNEPFYATGSFTSMSLREIIVTSSLTQEPFYATGSFTSMSLREIIVTSSLDVEPFYATGSFVSMSIRDIIITSSLYDVEPFYATGSFISMSTKEILTTSSLDVEPLYVTGSVTSIEVIIP